MPVAGLAVYMPGKGDADDTWGCQRGDVVAWAALDESEAPPPDTVASFDQVKAVFDLSQQTGKAMRIYVLRVASGDSPAHTFALTLARATEKFMPLDPTLFRHRLYRPYYILIHILIILSIFYPSSEILLKLNSFGNYVFVRNKGFIPNYTPIPVTNLVYVQNMIGVLMPCIVDTIQCFTLCDRSFYSVVAYQRRWWEYTCGQREALTRTSTSRGRRWWVTRWVPSSLFSPSSAPCRASQGTERVWPVRGCRRCKWRPIHAKHRRSEQVRIKCGLNE